MAFVSGMTLGGLGLNPTNGPTGAYAYGASVAQPPNVSVTSRPSGSSTQVTSSTGYPTAYSGQQISPGMQHPYHTDNYAVQAPLAAPSSSYASSFMPDILETPFQNLINDSQNAANWSNQSLPYAGAFQQAMFSPGMTPMEEAYVGSAAEIGSRNLNNTLNRVAGMFENSASHGSIAPAMMDATNQYNAQLNSMIGQMGTQRQSQAAQLLPFTMGFGIQANQAGTQGALNYYDMLQNAMYGDLSYPLAMFGSNPVTVPSVIATQG